MPQAPPRKLDVSFLALRQTIGWIGILMPWLVRLWMRACYHIPTLDSISAYYYTPARDVFAGSLFASGVFLAFYRGNDRDYWQDRLLGIITGLSAAAIGLFPMDPARDAFVRGRCDMQPGCTLNAGAVGYHFVPVTIFFAAMIYLTLFRFTKPSQSDTAITAAKTRRNRVYIGCGLVMIAACAGIFVLDQRDQSIFWPEAIAIASFGIAWITKGRGLPGLRE